MGNSVGGKFSSVGSFFSSKKSLTLENEELKRQIESKTAELLNYHLLLDENNALKEILGRKKEEVPLVLASILSKPNQSPYDTLIIDLGDNKGIKVGSMVFASANIPIGRVAAVYSYTSKVVLFSSPGQRTEVVTPVNDIFTEAVGRGGGNFEIQLPRDVSLEKGTEVTLPGINSYVLGIVEDVASESRDSFQKILIVSPVNIQELKFVQVEM